MLSDQVPGVQEFGDAPGLGCAAARGERWIPVKDFADAANAVIGQVVHEWLEIGEGQLRILVNAQVSLDKGAKQPTPGSALMIGTIPFVTVAAINADVFRIVRGKAAKSVRG